MSTLSKKLSDPLLRAELRKLPRGEHCDPSTPGFSVWIAKPDRTGQKKVTFNSRISCGTKSRPRKFLALWKDQDETRGLTVDEARLKFQMRKLELTDPDAAKKKRAEKVPTLGEAITVYIERRTAGDEQTAPGGRWFPERWDENLARFKTMMEKHLNEPLSIFTRDTFVDAKNAYLKVLDVKGHERMRKSMKVKRAGQKEIPDHKLRGMFSAMGPLLGWFVKKDWIKQGVVADLRPEQYDDDTRFLYPGEWQAACTRFDAMANEAGLFMRYIALTGSRVGAALEMEWKDLPRFDNPLQVVVDGVAHDCLIWLAHTKGHDEDDPQRILLIGETMDILRRLRKIFEANRKAHPGDEFDGVFSREILAKWKSCPSHWQRWIEEPWNEENAEDKSKIMVPWDRHCLRHTHGTYMGYVGTPKHLISTSLTHAMDDKGKKHADVTDIYDSSDTSDDFMEGDPLKDVAMYLLRLQKLFRDFERGRLSPPIVKLLGLLVTGPQSVAMRKLHKVSDAWIKLKESTVKLSVVA